jgi:hypothetical protein
LNDTLRPQASAADGENCVPHAIFFVRLRKFTSAAECAGRKDKVMKALAIRYIIGVIPNFIELSVADISNDMLF